MTALSETANQHLRELERVRKEQDAVIKKINKIHSKLCLTDPEKAERFGEKLWVRLRDFYEEAKELATKEDYISGLCIKEVESLSHAAVAPPPPPPPPAPPPPPPPPPPSAPPPSTLPVPLPSSAQPASVNQQPSSVQHHPQQANSQSSRKKSASAMMAGNTSMTANPSTASKRKKLKMVAAAGGGGGGEMGETVMISGSGGVIPRLASPSVSPRVTAGTCTQNYHPQHYHPQQHQHHHHHHHHHQQQQQQHHQHPSSASMEQTAIAVGDQVAARVTADDAEKDDWIVVKVTKYDRESNRYEVIDEEPGDDEESGQRKYKLAASCIIPFPKKGDQNQTAEFYAGAQVLAVYPGTTALYKAAVVRKRKGDEYLLEFDDDEEEGVDGLPQRSVPFYHTVPLPEGHRQ